MILFFGINTAKALPSFDNTIKVYDYAQILSDSEEKELKNDVNDYINKYKFDMVIVTVKYYMQNDTIQYIDDFYRINKFNSNGIIAVVDLKNNNIEIKTFGNTSNYYTEKEINNIKREINNEKTYYDKLSNFIIYSKLYIDNIDTEINKINSNSINIFSIVFISTLIPTVVVFIGILKNKNVKKAENANYYIKEKSIIINEKNDKFITTNTKKERINK